MNPNPINRIDKIKIDALVDLDGSEDNVVQILKKVE